MCLNESRFVWIVRGGGFPRTILGLDGFAYHLPSSDIVKEGLSQLSCSVLLDALISSTLNHQGSSVLTISYFGPADLQWLVSPVHECILKCMHSFPSVIRLFDLFGGQSIQTQFQGCRQKQAGHSQCQVQDVDATLSLLFFLCYLIPSYFLQLFF